METFYVRGESGSISTPNYPGNYGLNKDYYWTITAPQNKIIELTFEVVDIEGRRDCEKDYLNIFDGSSNVSSLLRTFCGQSQPNTIVSSGNEMYLHFKSDGDTSRQGFKLRWKTLEKVVATRAPTTTFQKGRTCSNTFYFNHQLSLD